MVCQKFLIFDYDDTIMPSNITRKLMNEPDYGANQIRDKLDVFFRFIKYWKNTTNIPIIILSAGTVAYIHLISLYGQFLRISVNYFDPNMDICIFIPIPFALMTNQTNILSLHRNNPINIRLLKNTNNYYLNLFKHHNMQYYSIHPSQIEQAIDTSHSLLPEKSQKEFINGISHKKIAYYKKQIDQDNLKGCFYLPGFNYQKEIDLYEFMNCNRQFKNLDALRRHIAYIYSKSVKLIHFYFFDDKASHLGMGDDDLYLSKPFKYPSTFFVGKIIPILEYLTKSENETCQNELSHDCYRRNEIKLLNKLVNQLSKTNNLVFVSKTNGSSPVYRHNKKTNN